MSQGFLFVPLTDMNAATSVVADIDLIAETTPQAVIGVDMADKIVDGFAPLRLVAGIIVLDHDSEHR